MALLISKEWRNRENKLYLRKEIYDVYSTKTDKEFLKVTGEAAKNLDKGICNFIYEIIAENEEKADLTNPRKFLHG